MTEDEFCQLCDIIGIDSEDHDAVHSALNVVCAMADRLRWRKQSEEPAPNYSVLYREQLQSGKYHYAIVAYGLVADSGEWRPL